MCGHRLDGHDYHALESIDSPHTAAALLKSFLRDLADPLIPRLTVRSLHRAGPLSHAQRPLIGRPPQ